MKAPYSVVLSLRARAAGDVTTCYRVFLNRKVVEAHTYTLGMLHYPPEV